MRVPVVTLIVSLAATAALTAPHAGAAAPADHSHWSAPVALNGEFGSNLLVAPDGSAQVETTHYTPNICPAGCDSEEYFQRGTDGAWARTTDPLDAYDGQSRGWDLGSRAVDPATEQVTIRSRPSGGAWGATEDVPDATLPTGNISARLVLTPDDRPVVVTTRPAGESFELRIAERRVDGTWLTSTRSMPSAYAVVATAAGAVRVAWSSGDTAVQIGERRPDGSWAPDVAVPGATGTPLWAGPDTLTAVAATTHRLVAADLDGAGAWVVHELGVTSTPPAAVTHPSGAIDLAWSAFGGGVMAASRTDDDGWSRPVRLGGLDEVWDPELTSDPEGNLTIGWVDTDFRTHVRQRPVGGSWLPELTVPPQLRDNTELYIEVGADATGKVTVVSGRASAAVLTPPDTVTQVSTPDFRGWTARPTFRVRWHTIWTQATGHDVRYRLYPSRFRGSFLRTPLVDTSARTLVEAGPAGTYCLQARARDNSDVVGAWSQPRCVTTPLDDRSFAADRQWTRNNGETRTRTHGATLVLRNVRAQRLALLVDRHSRGVVEVSFAGRSLGTFRLDRGVGPQHRIIGLGKLAKVRHGKLVVRVVSSGQPVRIEGVYAGR